MHYDEIDQYVDRFFREHPEGTAVEPQVEPEDEEAAETGMIGFLKTLLAGLLTRF